MRELTSAIGCALACAAVTSPAHAAGGGGGGGAYASAPAAIERVACRSACAAGGAARAGSVVRLTGSEMHRVRSATFLGGPGDGDDRTVAVLRWARRIADVRVPDGAPSGRVRVRNGDGAPSPPTVTVLTISTGEAAPAATPAPAPAAPAKAPQAGADAQRALDHAFPVRGPHDFGGPMARFGAGRPGHAHQGQDVFADCGTPLVAARGGVVRWKAFQARAGNYLVVDGDGTDVDYAYMHLQAPALVDRGARVATGERIGTVGDTGAASGCHLHFELWSGPGWHEGGRPFDPLASLRAWDGQSGAVTGEPAPRRAPAPQPSGT